MKKKIKAEETDLPPIEPKADPTEDLKKQNQTLLEMMNLREESYYRLQLVSYLSRIADTLEELKQNFADYLEESEEPDNE